VFLSLQVPTQSPEGRQLEALATSAKKRRFPIKVAVVAKRTDLGTAEALFGRAQSYADFLGQELRFGYRGTLIVVMGGSPGGVGVYGPAKVPPVESVARSISVPRGATTQELGRTGVTAVQRIAAAAGHPLPKPSASSPGGGGSSTRDRTIILVAAVVLATIFGVFWPRRRRRPRAPEPD
jgi:hypothetical protein